MKETIDYQVMYGDVTDMDFTDSLGLDENAKSVVCMLFDQRDGINPLYIPDLQIESLVSDKVSPYKALKILHGLKERRFVLYGISERVPKEPSEAHVGMEDFLFAPLIHQAKEHGILAEEDEVHDTPAVTITNYTFRRTAVFNLEYPVVYFCLKEEKDFSKDVLKDFYAAIQEGVLAERLLGMGYPVILEFLNYVQSMFQQPLTEVRDGTVREDDPERSVDG